MNAKPSMPEWLTYDQWCAAIKMDADKRLKKLLAKGSRKRKARESVSSMRQTTTTKGE